MKNSKILLLMAVLMAAYTTKAQVKGISYTLSPSVEYTDWNKNTGISNGYFVGGQLGFGFGQFVELKANYLQSINLQRDFSNFGLANYKDGLLGDRDITVKRYGGELKFNLAKGGIVPFLTAGAGVQNTSSSIMGDSTSERKNIYFSGGGGLQFSLGDRYTLALQAVNTSFNDSPVSTLLSGREQSDLNLSKNNFENQLLQNWSYRASILLYLGGRRPGELTDADKAYMENFSSGFKGISLPIEVTAGQLNFDKSLPYADAKYTGVSTGFNFGQYVGIRGFYWRTMDDGYFSSFNRLAIYGGEGKFKLSSGQGLTPYLNVGGGVIDALDGYEIDGVKTEMDNKPFVSGGVGLDLPFSRYVKLSGYAKALLTSNEPLETSTNPDELGTSMAYGLSLNFILGSRGQRDNRIEDINNGTYDAGVKKSMMEEKEKANKMKGDYQDKVKKLDKEIDKAEKDGDMQLMAEKYEERESARRFVKRMDEIQQREEKANDEKSMNGMNPTEFRKLVEELKQSNEESQEMINDRLDDIESSLNGNNRNSRNRSNSNRRNNDNMSDRERELQDEIDELKGNSRNSRDDRNNDNMSDRERDLKRELDRMKKQSRSSNRNSDMSDREQELQDEIDELKGNSKRDRNGDDMSDREKDLQKEINRLKKQAGEKGDDVKSDLSDREQELQDEIDDLKKSARKKGNNVKDDMTDREKELEKEVDRLKKDALRKGNDAREDLNDREKQMQDEIDDLKKKARKKGSDIKGDMSDREKDLQKEIDDLKKKAKKKGNDIKDDVEDTADDVRSSLKSDDSDKDSAEKKSDADDVDSASGFRMGNKNNRTGNQNEFGETVSSDFNSSNFQTVGYLTKGQREYMSENLPDSTKFFSRFNYDGSSVIGGFNLGGNTTLNLGVRSHYRYNQSNFYLVPEAFFGFGNPASFGLFANGVYQFKLKNTNDFAPYAGVGVGVLNIGSFDNNGTKLAANIVVGTYLFKVAGGRFYADLSARNFFKYNQIVAGYRLPF